MSFLPLGTTAKPINMRSGKSQSMRRTIARGPDEQTAGSTSLAYLRKAYPSVTEDTIKLVIRNSVTDPGALLKTLSGKAAAFRKEYPDLDPHLIERTLLEECFDERVKRVLVSARRNQRRGALPAG